MKTLIKTLPILFISTLIVAQENYAQSSSRERLGVTNIGSPGEPDTDFTTGENLTGTHNLLEGQFGPVVILWDSGHNQAVDDKQTRTKENIDPRISTPHDWFYIAPSKSDSLSDFPKAAGNSIKSDD